MHSSPLLGGIPNESAHHSGQKRCKSIFYLLILLVTFEFPCLCFPIIRYLKTNLLAVPSSSGVLHIKHRGSAMFAVNRCRDLTASRLVSSSPLAYITRDVYSNKTVSTHTQMLKPEKSVLSRCKHPGGKHRLERR